MSNTLLDKARIRHSFAAAAASYDGAAGLQRQVGLELLQRFPVSANAGVVLDVGSGTGYLSAQIKHSVAADLIAVDLALPMLELSQSKYHDLAIRHLCADAEHLPLRVGSVGQIYSNLALQWLQDLPAVFEEFKRVLQPGGALRFATFGPKTLLELKAAWATVDDAVHVNDFIRADEIAKALDVAGFHGLEMTSVVHKCRYSAVMTLMQELKGLGAHNVNRGRKHRPTTKAELQQMMANYPQPIAGQSIEASYEIIFVQARA